jgi:hypothetical protein
VDNNHTHHPEDALLLAPSKPKAESSGDIKAPAQPAEVSWMRSSNLFTRKGGVKRKEAVKIQQ